MLGPDEQPVVDDVSKKVMHMRGNLIAILEDDCERVAAMREALTKTNHAESTVFFDRSSHMIGWLNENLPSTDLISLDHDLAFIRGTDGRQIDPGDGRDVARWLSGQRPVCPIMIHTSNSTGADSMRFALEDAGWRVVRVYPEAGVGWVYQQWVGTAVSLLQTGSGGGRVG
jgi:hypothetical protein